MRQYPELMSSFASSRPSGDSSIDSSSYAGVLSHQTTFSDYLSHLLAPIAVQSVKVSDEGW